QRLLVRLSIIAREVDDRLDADGGKIGVVAPFGLRPTIVARVDAAEIVDSNRRALRGGRAGSTGKARNGKRERESGNQNNASGDRKTETQVASKNKNTAEFVCG